LNGNGYSTGRAKRRFTPWSKWWRGAGAGDQTYFTGQAAALSRIHAVEKRPPIRD
jgi:hypothetical protein